MTQHPSMNLLLNEQRMAEVKRAVRHEHLCAGVVSSSPGSSIISAIRNRFAHIQFVTRPGRYRTTRGNVQRPLVTEPQ